MSDKMESLRLKDGKRVGHLNEQELENTEKQRDKLLKMLKDNGYDNCCCCISQLNPDKTVTGTMISGLCGTDDQVVITIGRMLRTIQGSLERLSEQMFKAHKHRLPAGFTKEDMDQAVFALIEATWNDQYDASVLRLFQVQKEK